MTKKRAYTSQDGYQMVTAAQVGKRRRLEFNGQPTGDAYFSTHSAGKRRPVKHVMKGSWFFAYIESGDHDSADDGGESLQHILFKEALCTLERVVLSLYVPTERNPEKWCDAPIRIKNARPEEPIARANGDSYYADVYIEFDTDSSLGLRWEGKLFLEVCHKHPVDANKQTELRELDVPVIEVKIPDIFLLKFDEDDTTDERENAYRSFVKKTLEGENGFLKCIVLNNPTSKAFLEQLTHQQQEQITQLELSATQQAGSLSSVREDLAAARSDLAQANRANLSANDQITRITEERRDAEDARNRSDGVIRSLKNEIAGLKRWRWGLGLACLLLVAISAYLRW